jgi:hypothetical protein
MNGNVIRRVLVGLLPSSPALTFGGRSPARPRGAPQPPCPPAACLPKLGVPLVAVLPYGAASVGWGASPLPEPEAARRGGVQ